MDISSSQRCFSAQPYVLSHTMINQVTGKFSSENSLIIIIMCAAIVTPSWLLLLEIK